MRVFAFADGLEVFGILMDFWAGPFISFSVGSREIVNVGLAKSVEERNPDTANCSPGSMSEFLSCIKSLSHEYLSQRLTADCGTLPFCYLPPYRQWTSELPPCQNLTQARCTARAVKNACGLAIANNTHCLLPCANAVYTADYRSKPATLSEPLETMFYAYYSTTGVVYSREVALYDLNTIVAAVGGSMGLFLGFSCLDFALGALGHVKRRFNVA